MSVAFGTKISEKYLREIEQAKANKSHDSKEYKYTFITYYLSDMKQGAGAWATTHFNPDLDIRIFGLTAKQEKNLLNEATDSSREIIGTWLDESPAIGSKITIYRQNGKLYIEQVFANGSTKKEIMKKPSSKGQRFEETTSSSSGDYYLINTRGDLEMRDRIGLIATARKIKRLKQTKKEESAVQQTSSNHGTSFERKSREMGIVIGTPTDDVLAIRGQPSHPPEVVGKDPNGLIVEWEYSDGIYVMRRWTINGIMCYRVAEMKL